MKDKLTINKLAPYLPYGLKGEIDHPFIPYRGEWILLGINENGLRIKKEEYFLALTISDFKPLLLPLSEFNDDIFMGTTEMLIASVNLKTIEVRVWDKLIKGHFDVFGLIDKGLALNKLDYEK